MFNLFNGDLVHDIILGEHTVKNVYNISLPYAFISLYVFYLSLSHSDTDSWPIIGNQDKADRASLNLFYFQSLLAYLPIHSTMQFG
jgi:hypothetical protein